MMRVNWWFCCPWLIFWSVTSHQTPSEAGPMSLCPRLCPPLVRCSLFRSWRGLSIISRSAADLVPHQTRAEQTPTTQSPSPELTRWRPVFLLSLFGTAELRNVWSELRHVRSESRVWGLWIAQWSAPAQRGKHDCDCVLRKIQGDCA